MCHQASHNFLLINHKDTPQPQAQYSDGNDQIMFHSQYTHTHTYSFAIDVDVDDYDGDDDGDGDDGSYVDYYFLHYCMLYRACLCLCMLE